VCCVNAVGFTEFLPSLRLGWFDFILMSLHWIENGFIDKNPVKLGKSSV